MRRLAPLLLLALLLVGCGGAPSREAAPAGWQHARIEGLKAASGLTVHGEDLLMVAGGNDREVYVVARADLRPGGRVRARTLAVDLSPQRALMGSEPFALQGYEMRHLWKLALDFQGVAVQAPDYLYLGDRVRRVVYWGRLQRDAAGRLARLKLGGLTAAPGARRTKVDEGDWRDHGPGLAGLVALRGRARMEDLCVLDAAPDADGVLRIRRMDRYGSSLGTLRVETGDAATALQAISWDGSHYLVHAGEGAGRTWSFGEPQPARSVQPGEGEPGPSVEGVGAWTGMGHAQDGTIYLVSGGDPAVVAWRRGPGGGGLAAAVNLREETVGRVTVLTPVGDLDLAGLPAFESRLGRLLQAGVRVLLWDLSEVGFLPSTAAGLLLQTAQRLRAVGGRMALAGGSERVLGTLRTMGVLDVFRTFRDRDDALAAL